MITAAIGSLVLSCGPTAQAFVLVDRLGHPAFKVREDATRRLLKGQCRSAMAAVLYGAVSPDLEIQTRCRALYPALRMRAIMAYADEEDLARDLPGYVPFRRMAGWDRPARELFVALQEAEGGLLRSLFAGGGEADGNALLLSETTLRPDEVWPPTRVMAAALAAIGTDPAVVTPARSNFTSMVLSSPGVRKLVTGPHAQAATIRRVLVRWAEEDVPRNRFSNEWQGLIDDVRLTEILPMMTRTALDPKAEGSVRARAVCVIARLGTHVDVTRLAPLLEDTSHVTNGIPLGDIALAASVHLTGYRLADFGFTNPKAGFGQFGFVRLGLDTPAARAAALEKWKRATGGI